MSSPPIPPSDRLVAALWQAGHAQAALSLATEALARNDRRRPQLTEQLQRIRAGQALPEGASLPALDLPLVLSLVERYRYYEARTLLKATRLEAEGQGAKLARVLDQALAPFPAQADPSFGAVLQLVRAGQAPSALRAIDEVVRQTSPPPAWLLQRQRSLAALVRGGWQAGPAPVERVTRDTVLRKIRERDLPGALEAARAAGAKELSAVLDRLVAATERVFTDHSLGGPNEDSGTLPMEGHPLCQFQIRMGALSQADRGYRVLLDKDPGDEQARSLLADVIALRRALGQDPEPLPARRAKVSWLSKKGPRPSERKGAWAAGSRKPASHPRFEEDPEEESTDVLEASQEAELLLKLGKAQQALDMYRILAIRHPKQVAYQKRISEIEALIAQRMIPMAAEVTLKHDLSELQSKAIPTKIIRAQAPPRFHPDDEEFPTVIERVPGRDSGDDED